jgi:hypothetical protein
LPVLAVVATAAALIVLAALLLRRLGPQPAVWLHMTPAAATVEDAAAVVLSSGGWGSEEEVAICLNAPDDGACDAAVAILVERADDAGNLSVSLPAGPYLAEGRTAVVVRGLETDRQAGRTFRVLRAPETSVVSAGAATAPAASPTVDLTPIAGAQTPGDPASLVGGAWTAEYFANPDLTGAPAIVREEGELAFDWGAGAPDPALLPDGFSARWVRRLAFPGMTHRFVVQADGGARVFVDDVLLIDLWQDDGVLATASASIDLTPGEHTVRVEYFDQAGNAAIALRWEAIDLFPDWRGEYFTNPDLAGEPALVRNDPDPNLDWGENSPAPGVIPSDGFSVRWTRTLDFAPGLYRFILTADDGGRLLVEGQPVIEAWQDAAGETSTADRSLSGGQYQIVVQHRDLSGPARIAADWSLLAASTPVQIAGVTPTAPSGVTPTPAPVVTPSATPTVTPGALPSSTPNPETTTPTATETPVPTSSSTASPGAATGTPNGTVTAGATGTPTTTPDTPTPTATATPQTTGTPQFPPGSVERFIEINPTIGEPGQEILISSGNWAPGTVIRVSLGEFNTPYTMATPLPGVSFTTPTDSSQPWSFRFVFPNQPPWSTQTRPVQVWVHNAGWTEWGRDLFEFNLP